MQKLKILYAFLFIAALSACKDDDEDPSFKKADLIGKWEQTSSTVPESGDDSCTSYKTGLEFSDTELSMWSNCDGFEGAFDVDYAYDNKRNITFNFLVDMKYVILELNQTTLKIDAYYNDQKAGTATYKKL